MAMTGSRPGDPYEEMEHNEMTLEEKQLLGYYLDLTRCFRNVDLKVFALEISESEINITIKQ